MFICGFVLGEIIRLLQGGINFTLGWINYITGVKMNALIKKLILVQHVNNSKITKTVHKDLLLFL